MRAKLDIIAQLVRSAVMISSASLELTPMKPIYKWLNNVYPVQKASRVDGALDFHDSIGNRVNQAITVQKVNNLVSLSFLFYLNQFMLHYNFVSSKAYFYNYLLSEA